MRIAALLDAPTAQRDFRDIIAQCTGCASSIPPCWSWRTQQYLYWNLRVTWVHDPNPILGTAPSSAAVVMQVCLERDQKRDVDSPASIDAWSLCGLAHPLANKYISLVPSTDSFLWSRKRAGKIQRTRSLFVGFVARQVSSRSSLVRRYSLRENIVDRRSHWKGFAAPTHGTLVIQRQRQPTLSTTAYSSSFCRSFLPTAIHSLDDLESTLTQIRLRQDVQALFQHKGRSCGQGVEAEQDYISRPCEEEDAG